MQTDNLSRSQQSSTIFVVIDTLKRKRSDSEFDTFWEVILIECAKLDIDEPTLD